MGKPKLARLYATKSGGEYDADHIWAPCDEDEPYCEDVPTNPVTGYAADDSIVMDEVIRTTREKVRDAGTRSRPDLTFVNFPQIDSAGHATAGRAPPTPRPSGWRTARSPASSPTRRTWGSGSAR